jgi:hypothetical protein
MQGASMIDTTDAADASVPCPTCGRPNLLEELRCRSCGTRIEEHSVDAEEPDFSDDQEIPQMRIVIIGHCVVWGALVIMVLVADLFFVIMVGLMAVSDELACLLIATVAAPLGLAWIWITTRLLYREMQKVREIR